MRGRPQRRVRVARVVALLAGHHPNPLQGLRTRRQVLEPESPRCVRAAFGGSSPKSAKTYAKEPQRLSIWDNYDNKKGGVSRTARDIARNYGAHVAVCAMFANELAYFAQ
jgi:hypothetical protein